jgi:DNA-binding transcriptional LysR family regulator
MDAFQPARINLNLLRAFDAVARHKSFSRAGAELGRSQSTISIQVRELERQLEVRLLERTTRQVDLTEAGEALARSAQEGFEIIGAGMSAARAFADRKRGRVVVACAPSLSAVRLPSILAAYRDRDSRTRIDVEELTAREIVEAVSAGQVDFGIGPCADPPPAEIAFTVAAEEPLIVLLPNRYAVGRMAAAPLSYLATLPLITLSGSVLLQKSLEEAAEARGLSLSSQTEVRHVQTAIAMARAGVGAAIVPRLALPDKLDLDILALPITDPPMTRKVGIMALRGRRLSPAAAAFARFVSSALVKSMAEDRAFAREPAVG